MLMQYSQKHKYYAVNCMKRDEAVFDLYKFGP